MAEMASYVGIEPRTVINGGTTLSRGQRCDLQAAGTVAVSGSGAAGDYVCLTDAETNKPVDVVSMSGGNKVPALANATVAVGDPAYADVTGRFSNAGTVLVGRWTQPASLGALGEVELK